jgi:predicted  nucleic acid-binding Zn-ribbon protein
MDLTEIARLNEYHRGEVDKGNQFREKLKQTITDLHEEIAQVKNEKEEAVRHAITVERRAGRAEAMVDFMLAATMQKTNFENR